MPWIIITAVILLFIMVVLLSSIKVVNTGSVYVLERFGQYYKTLQPGWHVILPFVDYVRRKISMKQQILDIQPQNVITKDNVNISVDNVIFYQVLNPKDAVYNIENYVSGIMYSTITNMRNIIGDMSLDEVLAGRDRINMKLLDIVDSITDAYGIKILSVEIKNIVPPEEIQNAMEKQMKAERERRESILRAEGEKRSQILIAEGEQESQILRANAEKEAAILRAQGEAEAILEVQKATAEGIKMLNNATPTKEVLALRSLSTFEKVADGKSTKIIIPSEIQSLAGLATSLRELVVDDESNND